MNIETVTVKVENLTKSYAINGKYSLKDVSFEAYEGEIFGIIGENGSGKSTLLDCITGIIPMDIGDVSICGFNLAHEPIMAKRRFGFMPDAHSLYQEMTGNEFLDFIADMYGITITERRNQITKLAKSFGLSDVLDNIIESYSNGMKQKLAIISSLIHSPKVWLLDEPYNGLDALSAQELSTLMKTLALDNTTIIFSGQNLYSMANLCNHIAILKKGEIKKIVDVGKMINEDSEWLLKEFISCISDNNESDSPAD